MTACAFTAAAGCAAIAGFEELDFREAPATGDASTDTTTGTDGGGGVDGSPSDATAPPDALPDAPVGCDGSAHDFCDDFSMPITPSDASWTAAYQQLPGTTKRDNDNEELLVEMLESDAGVNGFNALSFLRPWAKRPSGDRNDLVVRWRGKVEACPVYAPMLRLTVSPSDNRFVIDAVVRELDGGCWAKLVALDITDAAAAGYRIFENLYVPISVGDWHAYSFSLKQAADGRVTAAFAVDDGGERSVTFASDSTHDDFGLFVGMYASASQHGRLRYDDVRIDWLK